MLRRTKKTVSFKKVAKSKKVTPSQVAKIARAVVMRDAETKSPINYRSQNLYAGQLYAYNLNYFISQGTTAHQITGEKVHIKNIRIRGYAEINFNANTTNNANTLRVFVIKTKQALTNTSTSITASDVLRNDGSGASGDPANTSHIDLHKVRLVSKDMQYVTVPQQANQTMVKHFEINIPLDKTEYYDGDTSGYFKTGNYYLIAAVQRPGDLGLNINTALTLQWAVNIKDN